MEPPQIYGISITCDHRPGVLRDIAAVVAAHNVNILIVQQSLIPSGPATGCASLYFELEGGDDKGKLIGDLLDLPSVRDVVTYEPFSRIFGSRVIIIGGGAQVAQVAMGAVNEADRHNIRGERISVDTIPLVGEDDLAQAVDAVVRLPRASILVLAGSLPAPGGPRTCSNPSSERPGKPSRTSPRKGATSSPMPSIRPPASSSSNGNSAWRPRRPRSCPRPWTSAPARWT